MMGYRMFSYGGHYMFGGIGMFLVLVALLALVFFAFRKQNHTNEPLEQLKLRLVKGEITPEDFKRLKVLI